MNEEKSWLTCREASKLLGCTQRNVLNVLSRKNISTDKDESGKHIIQKSEFFRVFPELMKVEQAGNEEKSSGNEAMKVMEEKIRHLQEMVDEKKKQNDFLLEQLSINTNEKSKMLDAISSHTRLLEYKETGKNSESDKGTSSSLSSWWPFKKKT